MLLFQHSSKMHFSHEGKLLKKIKHWFEKHVTSYLHHRNGFYLFFYHSQRENQGKEERSENKKKYFTIKWHIKNGIQRKQRLKKFKFFNKLFIKLNLVVYFLDKILTFYENRLLKYFGKNNQIAYTEQILLLWDDELCKMYFLGLK